MCSIHLLEKGFFIHEYMTALMRCKLHTHTMENHHADLFFLVKQKDWRMLSHTHLKQLPFTNTCLFLNLVYT